MEDVARIEDEGHARQDQRTGGGTLTPDRRRGFQFGLPTIHQGYCIFHAVTHQIQDK